MAGQISKKRKVEEGMKGKVPRPKKKFKKQTDYDNQSSSEDEVAEAQDFPAVNLQDSDEEELDTTDLITAEDSEPELDDEPEIADDEDEVTDASNSDSESGSDDEENDNPNLIRKRKRNDPEAFATSMSKILGSKLSTSKRSDPVLSRSVDAIQASKEITDLALEKAARHKMRVEKREAMDKGRVKDVLGASTAFDAANGVADGPSVQETMELEKRLRKTAQRGVVKLFNAVRAAQVKGEEAARDARTKGLVGHGRREEKVNEMSKKGFLDLIAGGGGNLKAGAIEEA
ncbi:Rrp15p-domain-containing protein [Rhexocercosporidium sp. MPI-PUGE-AT-0058]|nr:Rrp15p-domain-containing protein [Rhexocercosporidium sp. MPI-PUGE-AT-0058]